LERRLTTRLNANGPAVQFAKFNVAEFKLLDGEINPPNDHHNSPCQRIREEPLSFTIIVSQRNATKISHCQTHKA